MGITIIEKSTPRTRKLSPKTALVLAGGAISGGSFKLGGLAALDDYLRSRTVNDFDLYVGLSAGALLAAPLAAGLSPTSLLGNLAGSGEIGELTAADLYAPNIEEFLGRPLELIGDLTAWFPRAAWTIAQNAPASFASIRPALERLLAEPSPDHARAALGAIVYGLRTEESFPFPLDYLPSGLFDNRSLERFLRRHFESRGLTNQFRTLFRDRRKELYVVATNLDTAERVVFGHDEDAALTISEAVQASTALPGFYKPARIKGVDYVDGGVRRTANIDVAIEHGADLVICYNPFRPYNNEVHPEPAARRAPGSHLADHGLIAVANQVFRSLLHSRLHIGLNQYRDNPDFHGDIILIEPSDTDETFFNMFPLNFLQRKQAADHGYRSVRSSIHAHHESLEAIFTRYGITVDPPPPDEDLPSRKDGLDSEEPLRDAGNL